jgi:hypothetical protein
MQEPASSGLPGLALIDGAREAAREATREALPSEGSALVLFASLIAPLSSICCLSFQLPHCSIRRTVGGGGAGSPQVLQ